MEGILSDINYQMQTIADHAIKTAKDKFGQDLDYSEQSIAKLDTILMQVYSHFSNQIQTEELLKAINDAAVIWGSFLGEYMCRKWGGSWMIKGTEHLISILNIEFSPISFIYQKITNHPEYSVEIFLFETKKVIYLSVINPQPAQSMPDNVGQPEKEIPLILPTKKIAFGKLFRSIMAIGAALLFIIIFGYIGYINMNRGRIAIMGLIAAKPTETILVATETASATARVYSTNTQIPTITTLPTYTPKPTYTSRPTYTPKPTFTKTITSTPTLTQTPITPTRTFIPPTKTPEPPTQPPPPPPPTATIAVPVVLESCDIDPSSVPININTSIRFIVHFSGNSAGYGFDAALDPGDFPGQSGCGGVDTDGDGRAYCNGSSGELPEFTTVSVTFSTSVGECVASYGSK